VLVRDRSTVERRELEARAAELSAGAMRPEEARHVVAELTSAGELVELEGDRWTTRELRELELRTLDCVTDLVNGETAGTSEAGLAVGRESARRQLGVPLTREQQAALVTVTGAGDVAVLVGQAGTGKGVVIGAARAAWERDGRRVIGTAVAGATAKRLGSDAGIAETMTVDALTARHRSGRLGLDGRSVIVVDEAGMADTRRLAKVVAAASESRAKLLVVGDEAQLSPIGAGGVFAEIAKRVPTAELTTVRRAREDWERRAWGQLRAGEPGKALGEYASRDRLHIEYTRAEAGERMVADWARAREANPAGRTVMLTDASNDELDRLNALAQQRRVAAGELGHRRARLPDRPYDRAAGDEIVLTGQLRPPGEPRVENGTRATVQSVGNRTDAVVMRTEEPQPRHVEFSTREFRDVRLAYAQHIYKAQGLTADRALVLTGGWQTDRERAYVALTRARDRTDVYVSREDLGQEGTDADLIERFADRAAVSRAQQTSVNCVRAAPREPAAQEEERAVESRLARVFREQQERERARGRGCGFE
jgi:ATP-dependent exoDNAse (exonuclease V) alpha subunit